MKNPSCLKTMIAGMLLVVSQSSLACESLQSFQWLLGQWQTQGKSTVISESWQQLSDNTFEGTGQTYSSKKQKIVGNESLRLLMMQGEIFYLAKVGENPLPVAFKMVKCEANSVIFSNTQHDFPKHLHYQLVDNTHLKVQVTGDDNKGFEIDFVRQSH